jgi:hypothetical protein
MKYTMAEYDNKQVRAEVSITKPLTERDLHYIISGAVESGIGYWGFVQGWNDENKVEGFKPIREGRPEGSYFDDWCTQLLLGGKTLIITESEDLEEQYTLDLDAILKGIQIHHKERPSADPDYYDADDYDSIFQRAMFGRIVFG